MAVIIILTTLIFLFAAYGFAEYRSHIGNLNKIPYRIHVNGTRGKSSVTRLIAAGLRGGGLAAFAKTTGTLPRVITDKGEEFPVYRPFNANIIEQLRVFAFAAKNGADILVIECMALQPHYQSLTELTIVKSTHGVITNARADHLDVMGPGERDVARALLGTTPKKGKLFTCERDYVDEFKSAAEDRKTDLFVVEQNEVNQVSDNEMEKFSYVEHKENVALALKVCESVGIERNIALEGMWKVKPDVGAMTEYNLDFFGRTIVFVNGFAANDPESSERIWHMALKRHSDKGKKIMILNMRADRPDRSKQIGEVLIEWESADHYIMVGSGCHHIINTALRNGISHASIVNAEGQAAEQIFETIIDVSGSSALVMGIGNIKGIGLDIIKYFKNRSTICKE